MKRIRRKEQKINRGVTGESFTGKNLTRFGRVGLIRRFLKKLKIEKRLESIKIKERRESTYSPGMMCNAVLHGFLLGIFRPSHMMELVRDEFFQRIAGFSDFPVQSTISRFFVTVKASCADQARAVNDGLLQNFRQGFLSLKTVTPDLDSHVTTVYGNQQGAAKGYNPKKRGRKSFHPLLCFVGETRDVSAGRLRSKKTLWAAKEAAFLARKGKLSGAAHARA